jgi:(p)ppGpp synthase/HD superfamily hydrolase
MVITEEARIECRAAALAASVHAGQADRSARSYISHIARVVAQLHDPTDRVVAWLHDVVEDTYITVEDIRGCFGDEIADAVDAVTHRTGEPQIDYIRRVRANPVARRVKIADSTDNSSEWRYVDLPADVAVRFREKYARYLVWLRAEEMQ